MRIEYGFEAQNFDSFQLRIYLLPLIISRCGPPSVCLRAVNAHRKTAIVKTRCCPTMSLEFCMMWFSDLNRQHIEHRADRILHTNDQIHSIQNGFQFLAPIVFVTASSRHSVQMKCIASADRSLSDSGILIL